MDSWSCFLEKVKFEIWRSKMKFQIWPLEAKFASRGQIWNMKFDLSRQNLPKIWKIWRSNLMRGHSNRNNTYRSRDFLNHGYLSFLLNRLWWCLLDNVVVHTCLSLGIYWYLCRICVHKRDQKIINKSSMKYKSMWRWDQSCRQHRPHHLLLPFIQSCRQKLLRAIHSIMDGKTLSQATCRCRCLLLLCS